MGFDADPRASSSTSARPPSPVAYYQQVGRAGRGTDEASVVLLPAIEDRDIWAYFASLAFPREQLVRQTLAALAELRQPMSTATLETYVELNRTRLETMLKVLDVDGAVRRVRGGWEATGQDVGLRRGALPPGDRGPRARAAGDARLPRHRRVPDAVPARAARRPGGRRLRPLRQLRRAHPVGRRCPTTALTEATARLARPGVAVEPRKMWPTALANLGIDLKGKIAEGASEGRAVARLTDLGHGQALRALFAPATEDGPVPVPLVKAGDRGARRLAAARSTRSWCVESATRPTLTADLADGLSRYLQVPVVGRFAIVDPDVAPGQGAMNSAQRVAAVGRRFTLAGRRGRAEGLRCCSSTTWSSPAGR